MSANIVIADSAVPTLKSGKSLLLLVSIVLAPAPAKAAGFDLILMHAAKQSAMGGAAIAYTDDTRALLFNPAGLGNVPKGALDVSLTNAWGGGRATPLFNQPDLNVPGDSIPLIFPFLGGTGRINDYLTVGAAVFPSGGSAVQFEYKVDPDDPTATRDETEIFFLETGVGLAINVDSIGLRIGASYRMTFAQLTRRREAFPDVSIRAQGGDFTGFRVGFQWTEPTKHLTVGFAYRHKIDVNVDGDGGELVGEALDSISATLTLPTRLGGGIRLDFGDFSFVGDFEWLFNSQNQAILLRPQPVPPLLEALGQDQVTNTLDWKDHYYVRVGIEYRFFDNRLPVRLGFAYNNRSTSRRYPTPGGSPPAPAYAVTFGTGYNHGPWQMNVAYAYAWSGTTITEEDLGADYQTRFLTECSNCGGPGRYEAYGNFLMWDFSYRWGE
jgi:long-subunit fatty acid transport protein